MFGLHDNAALTSNRAQAAVFFESMMLLQTTSAASSSSSAGGGSEASSSSDDGIASVARDILARLPPLFDVPSALAKCFPVIYRPIVFIVMRVCRYPVCYEDSMNSVLTQELVRFNALLHVMGNSLRNLLLALKGAVLMSADLDDVATSLRSRLRQQRAHATAFMFYLSFCLCLAPAVFPSSPYRQLFAAALAVAFLPQRQAPCALHC